MNTPPPPDSATFLLDTYRFGWTGVGITAALEGMREERGGVGGVLSVSSTAPPSPGLLLPRTRINDILAPTWRRTVQQHLESQDSAIDWQAVIGQIITLSDARWREGEPVADLRATIPDRTRRWLIPNLIEHQRSTVMFADGGTGKSLLALTAALSVATGVPLLGKEPTEAGCTLYLDWEDEEDTHAIRMQALLEGYGLTMGDVEHEMLYRPQYGKLADGAASIRRLVAERDVKLIIVDSMGAATAGEDGREGVVKLFNAVRSFRTSALILDHVTKAEGQDPKRPYGSVYTHDLARATFRIDKAQEVGADDSVIALVHCKANNGRFLPKQAFRAIFQNDADDLLISARYEPWEILDTPALAGRGSVADGVLAVLRANNAPMTVADIQSSIQAALPDRSPPSTGTIRMTLNRLKTRNAAANDEARGDAAKWSLPAVVPEQSRWS